jgi:hypothetical protein
LLEIVACIAEIVTFGTKNTDTIFGRRALGSIVISVDWENFGRLGVCLSVRERRGNVVE